MLEWLSAPFVRYLPQNLSALGLAMVWGQKDLLNSLQYQMFRSTGLLHLLVLSGQNITLLVGFFGLLTRRAGLKLQLFVTICIALFYLVVFGKEPPIIRASLMAILSSMAVLWQSPTIPIFLLGLTCLIMLVYEPGWLGSLSFQLSVAATLGILVFYPYFVSRFKRRNLVMSTLLLSLSAQILTTPLLLINFRQIPLLTLPINVLAAWLVEPIMVLGVALSVLGNFIPPLAPILSAGLFGFLNLLEHLVSLLYPFSLELTLRI